MATGYICHSQKAREGARTGRAAPRKSGRPTLQTGPLRVPDSDGVRAVFRKTSKKLSLAILSSRSTISWIERHAKAAQESWMRSARVVIIVIVAAVSSSSSCRVVIVVAVSLSLTSSSLSSSPTLSWSSVAHCYKSSSSSSSSSSSTLKS